MPLSRRSHGGLFVLLAGLGVAAMCWLREGTSPPAPPAASGTAAPTPASASAPAPHPGATSAANGATTAAPERTTAAPRGPQLTGRLVQQGQPLPNVVLRLYTMVGYVPTATDQTVATAADGTFATAGLATGFWLRAEAPSVPCDWETTHQAPPQSDRDLGDVEPPVALALDLLVVDTTGHPVPEPRCWLSRSDIQVDLDPRDARAPRLVPGDPNGRVHLDRLHPGPLHLKVSAEGFAMVIKVVDLDNTPTAAPLQLTLTRGSRLDGRVFDWSGKPLPGASVSCEGRRCVTDDTGAFVLAAYGGAEPVHVEAKGHLPWWPSTFGQPTDYSHIQLERTVVLRGVVRGGNAATSIVLAAAPNVPDGVPWPGPHDKLACLLPVAADGTFSIDGLAPSDFVVHARSSLGASAGQRVALRGEAEIELTIDPAALIALRVVDAEGRPVDPVEVVTNLSIVEYPSLFGPHATDIPTRVFAGEGLLTIPAVANQARVPAPRDEPLALGVRSPGFLPAVRVFAAGEAPAELTIELARSGAVRGVVRGGRGPAYSLAVSCWPAEQDALVRAHNPSAMQFDVDAQGRFHREGLPPGDYHAALYHYGRARIGNRPDEQIGAVPLVDEDEDLRSVVAFAVTAATTTDVALEELPLGTLRGRVLQAGRAVAGAWVVAARPGAKKFGSLTSRDEPIDWDDEIDLQYVAGQRSGADGSFTFLYRDAGAVELRVRHAAGAATMPPVVVDLPPPGDDVHRDLEIALGGIRGRFVGAGTGAPVGGVRAVLFPLAKAAEDPFACTDYTPSLEWNCKHCDLDLAGNFAFAHVPDGEWLVRVTNGFDVVHAQRSVAVRGGETDAGELREPAAAATKVAWHWQPETPPRQVFGLWLYEERGGAPAIWVGTYRANADGAECGRVAPGKYLGVVFGTLGAEQAYPYFRGWQGITGSPLSKPFALEIRGDGTTLPATVVLTPRAADGR